MLPLKKKCPPSKKSEAQMAYGTFFGKENKNLKVESIHNMHSTQFHYIVKPGDTLESICKNTHITLDTLLKLNDLQAKSKVYTGMELVVDEPGSIDLPPMPCSIDKGWGYTHVVTSYDTLEGIALAYNTNVDLIRRDNREYFPIGERSELYKGMLLHIRLGMSVADDVVGGDVEEYVVRGKDTIEKVLSKYDMNIRELIKYNKSIFPMGSKLCVRKGMTIHVKKKGARQDQRQNYAEVVLSKKIHLVEMGDTPQGLIEMYNMSMDEFREWNRCYFPKGYTGRIVPGNKVVVKN